MTIKEFIEKELLTKDGKVKTAKIKNNGAWIKKHFSEFYNQILIYDNISFSQNLYNIIHNIDKDNPGCQQCGNDVRFTNSFSKGYIKLCKECNYKKPKSLEGKLSLRKSREKIVLETLANFYTEEDIELTDNFINQNVQKIKHTSLIKYNKEYSKILRLTSFISYDFSSIASLKFSERFYLIRNNLSEIPKCQYCNKPKKFQNIKYSNTCSKHCGTKLQSSKRINLTEQKIIDKLKKYNYKLLEPYTGRNSYIKVQCENNHIFEHRFWNGSFIQNKFCPVCFPLGSKNEYVIKEWLENLNIENIKGYRSYYNKNQFYEIDILCKNKKIGIEYNGLYWHSFGKDQIEDKKYHIRKSDYFKEKGIQIFHIFENEWLNPTKQEIWKSIIKSNLGINNTIGARKCNIKILSNKDSSLFLEENHLQGSCNASIKIGLIYNNEIVSILTLAKPRFNKNYDWEIVRFANKINLNVIGGFSKLLKYFRQNYTGSIITYADKRYSNGDLYRTNGFQELKDSQPNYFYTRGQELYSRMQFQKHKLEKQLKDYDFKLSEAENMFNNGYRRIWDCGNKVFVIK